MGSNNDIKNTGRSPRYLEKLFSVSQNENYNFRSNQTKFEASQNKNKFSKEVFRIELPSPATKFQVKPTNVITIFQFCRLNRNYSTTVIQIMNVYKCNDKSILMKWKMECSIQRGDSRVGWSILSFTEHSIFWSLNWLLMFSCKGTNAIYSVFYLFPSIFGIGIVNTFTHIILSYQNKGFFNCNRIYVRSVLARSLFEVHCDHRTRTILTDGIYFKNH